MQRICHGLYYYSVRTESCHRDDDEVYKLMRFSLKRVNRRLGFYIIDDFVISLCKQHPSTMIIAGRNRYVGGTKSIQKHSVRRHSICIGDVHTESRNCDSVLLLGFTSVFWEALNGKPSTVMFIPAVWKLVSLSGKALPRSIYIGQRRDDGAAQKLTHHGKYFCAKARWTEWCVD